MKVKGQGQHHLHQGQNQSPCLHHQQNLHQKEVPRQMSLKQKRRNKWIWYVLTGVVGWCEGAVYLTSLGRPTDIGLQLGKACYPCSG